MASSLTPLRLALEDRLSTLDEMTRVQGKLHFMLHQDANNTGWDLDTTNSTKYIERENRF